MQMEGLVTRSRAERAHHEEVGNSTAPIDSSSTYWGADVNSGNVERVGNAIGLFAEWASVCTNLEQIREHQHDHLRGMLRRGVPDCLRGTVWMKLARVKVKPGVFENLKSCDAPCLPDIQRDMSRTFPKHVLFRERTNMGQVALLNVLRAYSVHNPEVGYCQGMGFLAALLLMHMEEEDAFFMLDALLDKYALAGLFTPGLPLLETFFASFGRLLQVENPRLHVHLKNEHVTLDMFASHWFLTLFTYNLPFEVVVRIWDILLLDGSDFLFKIGLAILKLQTDTLLAESFEQILCCLKSSVGSLQVEELLRTAIDIQISSTTT